MVVQIFTKVSVLPSIWSPLDDGLAYQIRIGLQLAKFERFSQFYKDKVRRKIDEKASVILDKPARLIEGPCGAPRSEAREKDATNRSIR